MQIVLDLQAKLKGMGFDPGELNGELGPQTYAAFLNGIVHRNLGPLALAKGTAYAHLFPTYDMLTPRRISHFVAQCAHETCGFKFFTELGGPTYFKKYDGRMGNTQVGDGYKYRGRGDIQITGRSNYEKYGQRLGIDLVGNPDQASGPDVGTNIACLYWSDHGLNELADQDNVREITRRINGGYNGLAERQAYYNIARGLWGY